MRKLSSILTIFLVLCLTVGGVSAAWVYAGGAVEALTDILASVGMGTWEFGYTLTFKNEGRMFLEKQMNEGDTIDLYSTAKGSPIYKLWEQIKDFQENDPGNLKVDYSNFDTSTVEKFKENHFDYWINTGSTRVDSIESDRTEDLVLFPTFQNLYTAIFVDLEGNILDWTTFSATTAGYNKVKNLENSVKAPDLTSQSMNFVSWEVKETDAEGNNVASYALSDLKASNFGKTDITIYPVYEYNGLANLNPVDSDGDGDTDYYEVVGVELPDNYDDLTDEEKKQYVGIEIPDKVNGIKVEGIAADSFAGFNDLTAVKIPDTITSIGSNAFEDGPATWPVTSGRSQITMYFKGTPTDMNMYMDVFYQNNSKYKSYNSIETFDNPTTIFKSGWDSGLGDGSRIFFLDENDNVIHDAGYWELYHEGNIFSTNYYTWIYHGHPYNQSHEGYTNCLQSGKHYGSWTNYAANDRVDQKYWITTDDVASSEETTE